MLGGGGVIEQDQVLDLLLTPLISNGILEDLLATARTAADHKARYCG